MSDPKHFLSRWSERKLHPAGEKPAPEQQESVAAKADASPKPPAAEFDITTLPSLDSITANSDIRAFLQRGVPSELTRAALRRAWSADPAIRDFVGLSENSWDFNAPDSIPGFGSFTPEELKQAVKQFFGDALREKEDRASRESGGESAQISSESGEKKSVSNTDSSLIASGDRAGAASQQDEEQPPINSARQRRRHGGALPE